MLVLNLEIQNTKPSNCSYVFLIGEHYNSGNYKSIGKFCKDKYCIFSQSKFDDGSYLFTPSTNSSANVRSSVILYKFDTLCTPHKDFKFSILNSQTLLLK